MANNRKLAKDLLLKKNASVPALKQFSKNKTPGMLLFIDFEKAFDSLEWKLLFKVLEVMNFGPMFQT